MFDKTRVPVLGLVENMSTYVCPNCGHEVHIFGEGGVAAEAERAGLPFLGSVPLDVGIRLAGDAGAPIVATDPEAPQARAFRAIARRLIDGGIV
jgi:ATP-binding protein involved in chromosome partitioning